MQRPPLAVVMQNFSRELLNGGNAELTKKSTPDIYLIERVYVIKGKPGKPRGHKLTAAAPPPTPAS